MEAHTRERHGQNWAPALLQRAKDQREFKPALTKTRWGSDGLR